MLVSSWEMAEVDALFTDIEQLAAMLGERHSRLKTEIFLLEVGASMLSKNSRRARNPDLK
jgi:hypothetical protein